MFIIATVPGIPLPRIPLPTHGDAIDLDPLVTASSAVRDLGQISNDTLLNILQPDHVPFERLTSFIHDIVAKIPRASCKHGIKNNLRGALPHMTPVESEFFDSRSEEQQRSGASCLCRVNANKPMGTMVTKVSPQDARSGATIHWSDNRVVSLMEMRRFQGLPDDFILVGSKQQQMRQLGNSVAWASSNLLGRALAAAWKTSNLMLKDEDNSQDSSDCQIQPSTGSTSFVSRGEQSTKIEELSESEDDKVRSVTERDGDEILVTVETRSPLSPALSRTAKSSHITRCAMPEDFDFPDLEAVLTPTPKRSRQYDDIDLPNLADIVTPTKHHEEIVQKTRRSERLSITSGGHIRMHQETKSTVVVRRRSSSSDEESFKRPVPSFRDKVRVNVPKRTRKKGYCFDGHSAEDAIVLDGD